MNNPELNSYFQTLPKYVQEAIKQSSVEISDEAQLRKIAENMISHSDTRQQNGQN